MTDPTSMPDAVLFDFDGVIVDSEPLHCAAFVRVLEPLGMALSWDDYAEKYLGYDDRGVFREVFKNAGRELEDARLRTLIEAKAQAFEDLARTQQPKSYPGVVELIRSLAGRVPLALCSGALRRDVTPILAGLGIDRAFDVLVTADDVHASKPDPSSYLLALERLRATFPRRRIRTDRSVAIEDTPAGITAAQGAGVCVLALANTYPPEVLRNAARVVASLENVGLRELGALLEEQGE